MGIKELLAGKRVAEVARAQEERRTRRMATAALRLLPVKIQTVNLQKTMLKIMSSCYARKEMLQIGFYSFLDSKKSFFVFQSLSPRLSII